eukprot:2635312-Rhodomonas_salina.1
MLERLDHTLGPAHAPKDPDRYLHDRSCQVTRTHNSSASGSHHSNACPDRSFAGVVAKSPNLKRTKPGTGASGCARRREQPDTKRAAALCAA